MFFKYGETEIEYLKGRDARMRDLIESVGYVQREVEPELFAAVVQQIVGQQISTKAMETIWKRIKNALGSVNAETVLSSGADA